MAIIMAGMMGSGLMAAGGGATVYLTSSADFDGTNDYMARGAGLTGATDTKVGILSFWLRLDAFDGSTMNLIASATTVGGSTSRFVVTRNSSNKIQFSFLDATNAQKLSYVSNSSFVTSSSWHHCLASWNLATSQFQFYVDDVADTATPGLIIDGTIDYTVADWSIGALGGANKLNGCLAEFYLNTATSLDLSVADNRRKFRTSTGKPPDLGANGSTPTGSQPIIYQKIASGGVASDFATNLGSGGNFTVTGSLDLGSTSPSD